LTSFETSLYSEKVKFFKPTWFKLLFFAALLPFLYTGSEFAYISYVLPKALLRMLFLGEGINYYQLVFLNFFVSFVFGYCVSSIAEACSRIKIFKPTLIKLLLAALLPLGYLLWALPQMLVSYLDIASNCDLIGFPCGYNTMSLPQLVAVAFQRLNIYFLRMLAIQLYGSWLSTFILCYIGVSALSTIAQVLYAKLRKSKKPLPKSAQR
jgi:hypothetical protein